MLSAALCCVFPWSASGKAYQLSDHEHYITEYLNVSVGSDGTIYATGITDAGWMQEHSADVSTVIRSPSGRVVSPYVSVPSGGYARADASLPFNNEDGDFTVSADGDATCNAIYGFLGTAFVSTILHFGHSDNWYVYARHNSTTNVCEYPPIAGCNTFCQANFEINLPPCYGEAGTIHKQYLEGYSYWVVIFGSRFCIPDVPVNEALSPGTCSDTP